MTMKTIKWNNNFLLAGLLFIVSLFSAGGVLGYPAPNRRR